MKYCVIPARSGSKGIPRKNIKLLGGKPLIAYSILAAQESKCFDRIVVSTEDQEIGEVAKQYGAQIRERPPELAADHIHSIHAVLDCIEHYNMNDDDVVCMLLPTSPFRAAEDIIRAVELIDIGPWESIVSVVKCDHTVSSFRILKRGLIDTLAPIVEVSNFEAQRQGSELLEVNGSIYVSDAGNLREYQSFHFGRVYPHVMPKSRSLDINDEWDWKLAELIVGSK